MSSLLYPQSGFHHAPAGDATTGVFSSLSSSVSSSLSTPMGNAASSRTDSQETSQPQHASSIAGPSSRPMQDMVDFLGQGPAVTITASAAGPTSSREVAPLEGTELCKDCELPKDLQDLLDCCCGSPSAFVDACPDSSKGDVCTYLPFPDCSDCAQAQHQHHSQHLHVASHGQTLCAFPPTGVANGLPFPAGGTAAGTGLYHQAQSSIVPSHDHSSQHFHVPPQLLSSCGFLPAPACEGSYPYAGGHAGTGSFCNAFEPTQMHAQGSSCVGTLMANPSTNLSNSAMALPCGPILPPLDQASIEHLLSHFAAATAHAHCVPCTSTECATSPEHLGAAAPDCSTATALGFPAGPATCTGNFLPCTFADFLIPCTDPTHLPANQTTDARPASSEGGRKRTISQMMASGGGVPVDPTTATAVACPVELLQTARCAECTAANPQLNASLLEAISAYQACTSANCLAGLEVGGSSSSTAASAAAVAVAAPAAGCCGFDAFNYASCGFGFAFDGSLGVTPTADPNGAVATVCGAATSCCSGQPVPPLPNSHALPPPSTRPHKRTRRSNHGAASQLPSASESPSLDSVVSSQSSYLAAPVPGMVPPLSPSSHGSGPAHGISSAGGSSGSSTSVLSSPLHGSSSSGQSWTRGERSDEAAAAAAAAALLASGLRRKSKQQQTQMHVFRADVAPDSNGTAAAAIDTPGTKEAALAVEHICRWNGCNTRFETAAELTAHLTDTHVGSGKSEYVCQWDGCERQGRVFAQRQKLCRHLQSHTGDRPHECKICHKRFTELTTLNQHIRAAHTSDRPYKCDFPGCNKAFSVAGSLTIHKRTHSGEKPFKCPFAGCDKAFAESSNLSKHVRVHTGARPFVCPECGHAFARPDGLDRHRKIHKRQREREAQQKKKEDDDDAGSDGGEEGEEEEEDGDDGDGEDGE